MHTSTILKSVVMAVILLCSALVANAQNTSSGNVYVTHTDGTMTLYALTPQGTITFESDSVMLINVDGMSNTTREPLNLVAKVTFDKLSTSLPEVNESGLFVYPNPAVSELHLMGMEANGAPFAIYTTSGQLIQSGTMNGNTLNINNLQSGLYLLRIGNETLKFQKK